MMTDDQEFLEQLQKEFLDEVTFLLEQCEESYLHLEDPVCRNEELGKIFRLAHSMKGAGAAVGYMCLAGFAHVVEDCLSLLRVYPDLVDTATISVLLKSGDAFKFRIEMLRRKDPSPWKIEDLRSEVIALSQSIESRANGGLPTEKTAQSGHNEAVQETSTGEVSADDDAVWKELASATQSQLSQSVAPTATAPVFEDHATAAVKGMASGSSSIKIDADRVESVLNLVGELVVIKSQLMTRCGEYASDLSLNAIVSLVDKTVRELQDRTLSMRMTPLKQLFLKTQRVIRDLSIKLGKPVEFKMTGEDTEIDRTMVELLGDPLMHIARNSLDHGLEKVDLRRTRGKAEKGVIQLSAHQVGGRVVVKIKDDGGGIRKDKILEKAIERGLVPAGTTAASLSDKQVYNFIFAPGFSTAEKVTDVSGRGVGMDVVKTNIEKLKGTIDVETAEGQGTCLTISIPLTTSITDGMIVKIQGQPYIIPMDCIRELVNLTGSSLIDMRAGDLVWNHRGHIYPMINLQKFLATVSVTGSPLQQKDSTVSSGMVVLVEAGNRLVAMTVDGVLGQTQVVLKPMGESFKSSDGVAGAAILGDGRVALVLDPQGLASCFVRSQSDPVLQGSRSRKPELQDEKAA